MASGRFSPIQSPKRRSSGDNSARYSEDQEDLPPPPSYASSSASSRKPHARSDLPSSSGASVSSHRSATYSNLMSFLDEATVSSPHAPPPHHHDHDNDRDDVSSISNSTTLSPGPGGGSGYHHRPSLSSHKQYIWDDYEDKEEHHDSPAKFSALFKPSYHSSSSAAFSSSLQYSNRTNRGRDRNGVAGGGTISSAASSSSSLRTNIEEVKSKVERMKGELKIKNQSIKELQAELSRLSLARGTTLFSAQAIV
jgi:hypothetical protein